MGGTKNRARLLEKTKQDLLSGPFLLRGIGKLTGRRGAGNKVLVRGDMGKIKKKILY